MQFKAKVPINCREILKNTSIYDQSTPLDIMFQESTIEKGLQDFARLIQNSLFCKYFRHPKNSVEEFIANLQRKPSNLSRLTANKLFLLRNRSDIKKIANSFMKMDKSSPEYIEELAKIGASVPLKFVRINSEDRVLNELAKTNESTIFMLNHPNYMKDKYVYVLLNSMLNQMYVANGKQANCPRPKIVVSRNMLKVLPPEIAPVYKKLGLTPVDASLGHKDSRYNSSSMKEMLSEFIKDKSNIFMFPEGNNSKTEKTLAERIQPGIAQMARLTANLKGKTRIVPIGINYTPEKNNLGNIFIGQPINLERSSRNAENALLNMLCDRLQASVDKSKTVK